MAKYSEIA